MAVVTIRQLLDSGVHFGHQTRRWNPKVKRFILTERSGIHIIDLQQSLTYIDKAYEFVKETVAHGGTVLFVGTKKQAQEIIAEQATRVGQPYVNQRWLGGLLTNFQTVSKRLARMKELEELDYENPADSGFTKKELLLKKRELDKLHKSLGGIRNMSKTPSAIWVVDAKREHLAVNEATKLGIPIIGILDTNADPDEFQYPIPGNDDAIRSVGLLTRIIADAAAEGLIQRHQAAPAEGNVSAVEPLAEWEAELLNASEGATTQRPRRPRSSTRPRPRSPRPSRRLTPSAPPPPRAPPPPSPSNSTSPGDFPNMANFTLEDVKNLRERLGTGMVDTKNALVEADGDMDKAVEILRLKGAKGNAKRADRSTAEGLVAAVDNGDGTATMIELACETDFVAKGDKFVGLADRVLAAVAAARAETVEAALAAPAEGKTVADVISEEAAILGEKVELRRIRLVKGEHFSIYLHKTSKDLPPQVGVVLGYAGDDAETARSVAQHISFANPEYLTREDVPADAVEKERAIVEQISREEGKPEAALPKIIEGRLGAYFKQVALLEQDYAKDNKLSVSKVLSDAGLTVSDFARFKVGA